MGKASAATAVAWWRPQLFLYCHRQHYVGIRWQKQFVGKQWQTGCGAWLAEAHSSVYMAENHATALPDIKRHQRLWSSTVDSQWRQALSLEAGNNCHNVQMLVNFLQDLQLLKLGPMHCGAVASYRNIYRSPLDLS
jgi:hypothetical protein